MDKKTMTIIGVATVAVVIVFVASFIVSNNGGNDPRETTISTLRRN